MDTAMTSSAETLPATSADAKEVRTTPNIGAPIGESYREWYEKALPSSSRSYWHLALFSIFFLGSFGAWAFMAPIGGATVAEGNVIADGYNMKVNYRDGGIVSAIHVREGDRVAAGAVLAEIDVTEAETNLDIQKVRSATAEIRLARYRAEESDSADIKLADDILAQVAANDELAAVLESQKSELAARLSEKRSSLEIYEQRIASDQKSLDDLSDISNQRRKRIADLEAEIKVSDDLLEKGYTTRDRNYNQKRQLSIDEEQLETLMTQISDRRSKLTQTKEDKLRWMALRTSDISSQIVTLNAEKAEAVKRTSFYEEMIRRATIRAPEAGHVVRSYINTIGSSVPAGDPLFEILPEDSSPIVEVFVGSRDIDAIAMGGKIDVRISSQDRDRSLMLLKGEVSYISYDAIPVGNPPKHVYVVRGKIDKESVEAYGGIKNGTRVSVFFLSEPKNFIHYIVDPYIGIRDKAFTH